MSAMKEGNECINGEINGLKNDVNKTKTLNLSEIKNGDIQEKLNAVKTKQTESSERIPNDKSDGDLHTVLNGKIPNSSRETTPSDNSRDATPILKTSRNSSRNSTPVGDTRCNTPTNTSNMDNKEENAKDTSVSVKPITKMPKARKSALPISKQSQDIVAKNIGLPPSNLTVKLPDFDSPIKLNSSMLEELSNLGRSNKSKSLGGQRTRASMGGSLNPPKIMRQRATMGSSMGKSAKPPSKMPKLFPSVEKEPTNSEISVKEESNVNNSSDLPKTEGSKMLKIRSHKRKKRMGTYKLPLEKKKNKTVKKKEKLDGEDEEIEEHIISVKEEKQDDSFITTDNTDCSMDNESLENSLLRTPKDSGKTIAHRTKNTLGSTRQGRTPPSAKTPPSSKKLHEHKGKPITEYFSVKSPNSSQTNGRTSEDSESLESNAGVRKRKKEDEDDHIESNSTKLDPNCTTGKKKRIEEPKTSPTAAVTKSTSMPTPTSMRSILPKSIKPLVAFPQSQGSTPVLLTMSNPNTSQSNLLGNQQQVILLSPNISQPLVTVSQPLIASTFPLISNPMNSVGLPPLDPQPGPDSFASSASDQAPVLHKVIPQDMEGVNDTEASKDSLSVSSETSYPVTPPKTPDDQLSEDSSISAPSGPTPPDKDVIPLCCCKINGASFKKLGSTVTYCQALDSMDGKVMGCCNKVTNYQLIRPGVKIPFMAICEPHRKRLRFHACCPGCGHFCTQGKFYQCRKEGAQSVHYFHHQCQVVRTGKYFCPHCGEESHQVEVSIELEEPRVVSMVEDKSAKASSRERARMGLGSKFAAASDKDDEESATASFKLSGSDKFISTGGISMGPEKTLLERVLKSMTQERPKKYRNMSKYLYNAAYEADIEKVMYMLEDGQNPDDVYEEYENQTGLHAAAISGSLIILHILVQAGASINVTDQFLKTPLMYAAENNHESLVKYLLKIKADVNARADDGMTVIHYAAKAGHNNVIKILLDTGEIDINIQDDGGWTPIIWASEHKLVSTVKFLLNQGAQSTLKDKEENTSLHWAAYSGSVDICEMFLNGGCMLDAPNEHGDRPLHIAARQNHYECVVLFLARGADVELRNSENDSPIQCCLDEDSQVCLALKVNKQLKGFAASRTGRTEKLIHRDVSMGRENIPIPVYNGTDDEPLPTDYQYVTANVETADLHINRTISSLQSCRCSDDCSSMYCVCGRNSIRCWYDKTYHLVPEFNMSEPPLIFECNVGCRCWSTCNNRVVQNGISCRMKLIRTNGRGWGVITLLDIPKGSFICEYIGELLSDSEADSREDDSYLFDLDNRDGDTYCIDARRYGNISRFINHLCEPNIIPVKVFVDHQDLRFPRICFFSSRDIKANEELGFDYGEKFWMIKWKQFTCACGGVKCKYNSETIHKTIEEYKQRHEEENID
ncbi:histone-lysine N-methyltransferase EHMT2-like isoform X2 [Mytilus trossulus]